MKYAFRATSPGDSLTSIVVMVGCGGVVSNGALTDPERWEKIFFFKA
jgi:hypothetical protein